MKVTSSTRLVQRTVAVVLVATAVCFTGACAGGRQLMPAPNLYADMKDDPFADVPAACRTPDVPVLYVTDRAAAGTDDRGVRYSTGRSRHVAVGTAWVSIGEGLSWDQLRQESRARKRRHKLPLTVERTEELPSTDHLGAVVARRLGACHRPHAYVYVHGYNNTFEDAVMDMAELWHFLGRDGVPIVYSWPAGRWGTLGYFADRDSARASVGHFKTFLTALAHTPGLEKVHVIAHSTGADLVATALREMHIHFRAQDRDTRRELKLGELVVAAPDMDLFVIEQRVLAEGVHRVPERITIYACPEDRAIRLAEWLHAGFRRLGRFDPKEMTAEEIQGLTRFGSIDVVRSAIPRTDFISHTYFLNSPAVSSDLILLLRYGRAAGRSSGRPMDTDRPGLWEIRKGYPYGETALPVE